MYKYILTSISKNVFIEKSDDIVHKYNNTYHSKIKMKPILVTSRIHIDTNKEIKILNLKLVIFLEYQNIKTFLQKVTLQIGLKKFF